MDDPWQFCESSLPRLQCCIDAAKKHDNSDNIWLKQFGDQTNVTNNENTDNNTIEQTNQINIATDAEKIDTMEEVVMLDSESPENSDNIEEAEIFSQVKELDPIDNFEDIVLNCIKNPKTYSYLANNLPLTSIEKLCEHIFDLDDLNDLFVDNFYKLFFPELLKRGDLRLPLDLLVKAKKYEDKFENLLNIIINDINIPKFVLQEYVSILDYNRKMELLEILINTRNDVFIHHMHTIHLIYKEVRKSEKLQKGLSVRFVETSQFCENEKVFGKFLLNFLQVQKDYSYCNELEVVIDRHTSIFKMPCLNALNEIKTLNLSQI